MTQFQPALIRKIAQGEKTQTRRPVKAGDFLSTDTSDGLLCVRNSNYKIVRKVGCAYKVQPGRGKKSVLWAAQTGHVLFPHDELYPSFASAIEQHTDAVFWMGYDYLKIRILDIRREDVRLISHDDAIAEGFRSQAEFLAKWCEFYMPALEIHVVPETGEVAWLDAYQAGYSSNMVNFGNWLLSNRPRPIFDSWAITFEAISE